MSNSWSGFLLSLSLILFTGCTRTLPTQEPGPPVYTAEEIAYFSEIAFGAERGHGDPHICKWTSDIRLQIHGTPAPEDLEVLHGVVDELNVLIQGVRIEFVEEAPTVEVHFVSQAELDAFTRRPCHCLGIAVTRYDVAREIRGAQVYILTTAPLQKRMHAIREEITQMLGLMVDSYTYPESIFYQDRSEVTEYAEIDAKVIEMLYRPEVVPGMTREQAGRVLSELRD